MTPKRIQRRRTLGWRMPPNTVSVTRPGPYGNPFTVKQAVAAGYQDGPAMAVYAFREWIKGNPDFVSGENLHARQRILNVLAVLRGAYLACFCKLCSKHSDGKPFDVTCDDCDPCHVDVLLKIANRHDD